MIQSSWALVFCIHQVQITGLSSKSKEYRGFDLLAVLTVSPDTNVSSCCCCLIIVMLSNDEGGGPWCGFVEPVGWFPVISGCFFPCGHLVCNGIPSSDASEMATCIWISQGSCWSACLGLLDLGEDWDSELLGDPQVMMPSLLVKTLVLSSKPPGYLWKPPQGTQDTFHVSHGFCVTHLCLRKTSSSSAGQEPPCQEACSIPR